MPLPVSHRYIGFAHQCLLNFFLLTKTHICYVYISFHFCFLHKCLATTTIIYNIKQKCVPRRRNIRKFINFCILFILADLIFYWFYTKYTFDSKPMCRRRKKKQNVSSILCAVRCGIVVGLESKLELFFR